MLIVYLNTIFHMPNCNGLLVTDIKLKPKENVHIAIMMPFTFYKNIILSKLGTLQHVISGV
jgi:hypothetical protein